MNKLCILYNSLNEFSFKVADARMLFKVLTQQTTVFLLRALIKADLYQLDFFFEEETVIKQDH